MKPGDRLLDHINKAIEECKVGVAIFSPRCCESHFCLHELCLMIESKKRVIPIFYDVRLSELKVEDNGSCPAEDHNRFSLAVEEAKHNVGLVFDSSKGDWLEFIRSASDAVIMNLLEVDEGQKRTKNLNT